MPTCGEGGGRRAARAFRVPGTDGAGRVAAFGRASGASRSAIGSGLLRKKGGFYAEYAAVRADKVAPVPRPLDLLHAGAAAATGMTALQGVDDALHVRKREAVIIHGAAGGVGSLAIQFAKRRGARVLATASGRDGLALVRRLGADAAVDGRREDIVAAARRFAPEGVDAVLAFAGGKSLTRCLDALRRGGRVAYPNGVEPPPRKRRGLRVMSYDGIPECASFGA
jgi:NADPH:quinone reductase-like Zn-dependent oxidoreductase